MTLQLGSILLLIAKILRVTLFYRQREWPNNSIQSFQDFYLPHRFRKRGFYPITLQRRAFTSDSCSYADRAKIVALLENDFKYSPVQFLREDGSLITMTQLRGLIGRNRFNELIETGLIAESEPKYKLVSTK